MTQKVTKGQQAVLDCIEACIREKGYGPYSSGGVPELGALLLLLSMCI